MGTSSGSWSSRVGGVELVEGSIMGGEPRSGAMVLMLWFEILMVGVGEVEGFTRQPASRRRVRMGVSYLGSSFSTAKDADEGSDVAITD